MNDNRGLWTAISCFIIGIALIICFFIASGALLHIKGNSEIIEVVGSAKKPIRSDFIIWRGTVTERNVDKSKAYASLLKDIDKSKTYILGKGIDDKEIFTSAIKTKTLYAPLKKLPNGTYENEETTYRTIEGYELTEYIEIRSSKVDQVGDISRKSTELLSSGVPFESGEPQYLYTKLSDLKVTMLAEAAKDARNRADQIAANSGCSVGTVRYAHMGALQITPIYSTDYSSGGVNDTTSLDKEITAIVTMNFSVR